MGYERKRGKLADLNALLRGARARALRARRRRHRGAVRRALRHHARHRHAAAARRGAQARRRRWRTRSTARASTAGREAPRVIGGYGILQPRVGVSLRGASRSRFARLFGGEAGIDPYTRAVSRRLPGPVRRGLVHRQGHLRRRCVRAGARRPAAREPHPQPRPARRLLRARGPGQRRRSCSRTRPRATPPTSGAATAGSAATGRSAAWLLPRVPTCRARRATGASARTAQSAVGAVALEDPRQPAAQPRAGGADCCLLLLGWAVLAQPPGCGRWPPWRCSSCRR